MFGSARPAELEYVAVIAAPLDRVITCSRCQTPLDDRDVAFLTRTRPGDAFDPWCPQCSHQLVKWAGVGAHRDPDFPFDQDDTVTELGDDLGRF